ncbi:methionine biosynthesis protein MetW, partial [Methylobacterium sp. WL93]
MSFGDAASGTPWEAADDLPRTPESGGARVDHLV